MLSSSRLIRNSLLLHIKIPSSRSSLLLKYSSEASSNYTTQPPPKKVTFRDKYKEVRNGPAFKYWVIGTTAFLSWMTYYGLKTYKKTRIHVEIQPALSSHVKIKRSSEIQKLLQIHSSQSNMIYGGDTIKKLLVQGAPGVGKTTVVYDFVKELEMLQNGMQYSFPTSSVTSFIQCDSEDSFLQSLKALAAKLKIKLSDLEEYIETPDITFNLSPFDVQCNALLQCIQDTLKKHPRWILVFDHLQATSPASIGNVIGEWFLNENVSDWSKGTVVMVYEGIMGNQWNLKENLKYTVKKGLSDEDACSLIKEITNLEKAVANSDSVKELISKVYSNPLGIVCVGLLLKEKLSNKEIVSIERAVNETIQEINENIKQVLQDNSHLGSFVKSSSGLKLVILETVIAMVTKTSLENDKYLRHGFDMMSTLKPNTTVPQSLIARHLSLPYYRLPRLAKSDQSFAEFYNKQKSDLDAVKSKVDEFEPKGKAWSNKNLAEYIRKVEDFFSTTVQTVTEIYNMLYGELPPLPEKQDGLDFFRKNDMLMIGKVEPGGSKSVTLHPLVYNAVRQHFLANTVYKVEENNLFERKLHYDNQPWYRRFNGFSEQRCLHQHRLSAGHSTPLLGILENIQPDTYLFRYNMGINVSSVYNESQFLDKTDDFWLPKGEDKLRYLQDHISRVITSLCEEILVTKEDANGRSVKKILLSHLEYILDNQPRELMGTNVYVEGLQTVANCYSDLFKDVEKSKEICENILEIQQSLTTTNPLDIGKTMTKIAEIHNANGEYEQAKVLLEEASELYEIDRRKHGEYKRCLEFGKLLGLLGVVYASLGRKVESKETIERSLMLKQATPPDLADEGKSKQFGSEFASSLTDLGHSYVSLGLPLYGKKILDLALSAHRNLHGENHTEVVRTLTILAIAHLMQGNNEESKKLRREAGKVQSSLNTIPIY